MSDELPGFPVSPFQEGMWFLQELYPGDSFYSWPRCHRVRGDLDVTALRGALDVMMRRHELLRSTYEPRGGQPVQVVHPPIPFPLMLTELSGLTEEERDATLRSAAAGEGSKVPSLEEGPLVWGRLFRFTDRDYGLMLAFHHLVMDGWSMAAFYRELRDGYDTLRRGGALDPHAADLQYRHVSDRQRWARAKDGPDPDLQYWRDRVAKLPSNLSLPTDRPRDASTGHAGANVEFEVPQDVAREMRRLCLEERCTTFMGLLGAFHVLVHRWSDAPNVPVGVPVGVRDREEDEDVLGFFVNTLVICGDLRERPSFRTVLWRTRREVVGALSHRSTPFAEVVASSGRQEGTDSLVATMFQVYDGQAWRELSEMALPGVTVDALPDLRTTARFDLELRLADEGSGSVCGILLYNTDLFDPATADRLVSQYLSVLEAAVTDPDGCVDEMSLGSASLPTVPTSGSGRALGPMGRLLDAAPDPRAVAVTCLEVPEIRQITYQELLGQSAALAADLRRTVSCAGRPVAVLTELSTDTVVGSLAVLGAQAICLPLDPDADPAMLAECLKAAGPVALVTHRRLETVLPPFDGPVLYVDGAVSASCEETSASGLDVPPDRCLAYLLPGWTQDGQLELVGVDHKSIGHLVDGTSQLLGDQSTPPVLAVCELGWPGTGIWMMWTALTGGNRFVLLPPACSNPEAASAYLDREGVSILGATSHQVDAMAEKPPTKVEVVVTTAADPDLKLPGAATWVARPSGSALLALLEKTDDGVASVLPGFVPIIEDATGRLCPPGVVGDLLLSSGRSSAGGEGSFERTGLRARYGSDGRVHLAELPGRRAGHRSLPARKHVVERDEQLGTHNERLVAEVWSEVLDVMEIGARSDFFELGGHSLLAAQVVARLRSRTGHGLSLRAIFDAPTVRELAHALDELNER